MSGLELFAALALIAAAATVQGCAGIGLGLVAAPGLVAIDPAFGPGPLLAVGMVVGARHIIAERPHADVQALRNCFWGLPIGVAAGVVVLSLVDSRTMAILVGLSTAAAALAILVSPPIRRTRSLEVAAGAFSAFGAVTAAIPGPPLILVFANMKPNSLRFTVSAFLSGIILVSLVALPLTGNFGRHELFLTGLLAPGAFVGLGLARYLRPILDRPGFRTFVLVLAIMGGLVLVARSL